MRRQSEQGFTMIEMVVALAILGVLVMILASLESNTARFDREMRIDLFTHPEKGAVLSRFRADVLDARRSFPTEFEDYEQTDQTLILQRRDFPGEPEIVTVWDFREEGAAKRILFEDGEQTSQWTAKGVPKYKVSSFTLPMSTDFFVRLQAFDSEGRIVVDQITLPRAP